MSQLSEELAVVTTLNSPVQPSDQHQFGDCNLHVHDTNNVLLILTFLTCYFVCLKICYTMHKT